MPYLLDDFNNVLADNLGNRFIDVIPNSPITPTPIVIVVAPPLLSKPLVVVSVKSLAVLTIYAELIDNGLAYIVANAVNMALEICSATPISYADATSGHSLGNAASIGITGPSNGIGGGRIITVGAATGTVNVSGTPVCWAMVDTVTSSLVATGGASGFAAVTVGQTWTLGAFTIHMVGGPLVSVPVFVATGINMSSPSLSRPRAILNSAVRPVVLVTAAPSLVRPLVTVMGPLKIGLVGYWEMQTTAWADSHTSGLSFVNLGGNTGTLTNPVGRVGNCMSMTGGNYRMDIVDDPKLNFTANWTVAFWVKVLGPLSESRYLITKEQASPTGEFRTFWTKTSGTNWAIVFSATENNDGAVSGTHDLATFWQANFHFVTLVYNKTISRLSIAIDNGTPVTGVITTAITHTANNFTIGEIAGAGTNIAVDQLGFWTRVLTAQEITQLYNGGVGRAYSAF